jgi:hypothetical protein
LMVCVHLALWSQRRKAERGDARLWLGLDRQRRRG